VNIFIDYETIGERQWKETGIFDFFSSLPRKVFAGSNFSFHTPTDLANQLQTVSSIHVPNPISWADEERDLASWLGNDLQYEAFQKLYSIRERMTEYNDPVLQKDWSLLQTSDHFYYMSTKWFSDGAVHKYFNPYTSPYEAFINYMNVLSDFLIRLDFTGAALAAVPGKAAKAAGKPKIRKGKLKEEEVLTVSRKTLQDKKKKAAEAVPVSGKVAKKEKEYQKFNFDDIIGLSDRKVKLLVKHLDIETVSYAMAGSGKELRMKVEKNLGKRALKTYLEILKQIKTLHESEIKKSKRLIEKQIRLIIK